MAEKIAPKTRSAEKPRLAEKQKIRIRLKAYDHRILDKAARKIIETAEKSGAVVVGPIPLPTEIRKHTVLRSTFIKKDSREQFEMRIHKRLIDVLEPASKTIDDLMGLELPAGVDIEIKMQHKNAEIVETVKVVEIVEDE